MYRVRQGTLGHFGWHFGQSISPVTSLKATLVSSSVSVSVMASRWPLAASLQEKVRGEISVMAQMIEATLTIQNLARRTS